MLGMSGRSCFGATCDGGRPLPFTIK